MTGSGRAAADLKLPPQAQAARELDADALMAAAKERLALRDRRLEEAGIPSRYALAAEFAGASVVDEFFAKRKLRAEALRQLREARVAQEAVGCRLELARDAVRGGFLVREALERLEATQDADARAAAAEVTKAQTHLRGASSCSLLLMGPKGTHKTHIASCIARRAVDEGLRVWMVTTVELCDRLKHSFDDPRAESASDLIGRAERVDVLVLDDLGKEVASDWVVSNVLFRILNHRYNELKDTVVTSQLESPKQIRERLMGRGVGDQAVDAVLRRILDSGWVCSTAAFAERDDAGANFGMGDALLAGARAYERSRKTAPIC